MLTAMFLMGFVVFLPVALVWVAFTIGMKDSDDGDIDG